MRKLQNKKLFNQVVKLLLDARQHVVAQVNLTMVKTYFEIGRLIVEDEQNGDNRAEYGKNILEGLSTELTKEFGKGFSVTNIRQMRNFYLIYRNWQTVSAESEISKQQIVSAEFKLSWSHYLKLMRIEDLNERQFYEIESIKTIGACGS